MRITKSYIYFFLCVNIQCYGITIVYNFRIAETTRPLIRILAKKKHSIAAITAFAQFRKLLKNVRQSAVGGLVTYIFMKESFFARINAAFARVHAKAKNNPIAFSRTQTDDILFTAGYSHPIKDNLSAAISAHFGVPTHEDTSLQFLQFGTGHFAFGGQLDLLYALDDHQTLTGAMRFLHFFTRSVHINIADVNRSFDFTLGNVADLLFSYQYNWQKQQIQVGYNPTFIFDASIKPPLPNVLPQINTIAHNIFGSYRYAFLINHEYPSAIIIGTSVGLVPQREIFGNTTIVTTWFSWGINF